ncbi:hypothetical protein K1719_032013 [Acacia pycnantha]|nr:hypothetical protein K1719_032013 [Acacia pycnantha]
MASISKVLIFLSESYVWWMHKPFINATYGSPDHVKKYNVTTAYRLALKTWCFFMTMSPTHLWSWEWKPESDQNCFNESHPSYWGIGSNLEIMTILQKTIAELKIDVTLLNITQHFRTLPKCPRSHIPPAEKFLMLIDHLLPSSFYQNNQGIFPVNRDMDRMDIPRIYKFPAKGEFGGTEYSGSEASFPSDSTVDFSDATLLSTQKFGDLLASTRSQIVPSIPESSSEFISTLQLS